MAKLEKFGRSHSGLNGNKKSASGVESGNGK